MTIHQHSSLALGDAFAGICHLVGIEEVLIGERCTMPKNTVVGHPWLCEFSDFLLRLHQAIGINHLVETKTNYVLLKFAHMHALIAFNHAHALRP